MKKKLWKTFLVIVLIITMTLANFILLGNGISIAMSESNIKNVTFDAYFNQTQALIGSEPILILEINVKEKGVLNEGKIRIENANFKIQKNKIQNNYIQDINIETNEILLHSILYEKSVKLEIPIQFDKKENFEADYFQKEASIFLEGTYQDEKGQKIEAQRNISIDWIEEADISMKQEITKYIKLNERGTLLQQEIKTEVLHNALPRENETVLVKVPVLETQQPTEIYVMQNGIKLADENVQYTKENNVLQIKGINPPTWKQPINTYQVVYIYEGTVEVIPSQIELNTTTTTQLYTTEAIEKQEIKQEEIEPKGNVVSLQKEATSEIYKGYLYAKAEQDTIFTESNTIQITDKETVDSIELTKENEEFSDDANRYSIKEQTTYKSTTIKKEEFNRILGEEGKIIVTDEADNKVAEINQQTEADEQGNITLNYETEVNHPKIIVSKPITVGEITITNTKAIKSNVLYSKEQLKTFTKMITTTKVNSEIAEASITLKDTKTEAKLEINNTNLSTLQVNENVQFLLTLKSNSMEYDLYKNPIVKIVLPTELSIQVKNITQLNGQEEIKVANSILYENEAKEKVIELQLKGEQTHFENNINEGIQISIIADICTDKITPSKEVAIKMLYTNENRVAEEFTTIVPVKLNSKYGVLMVNTLSNYKEEGSKIENIENEAKEVNIASHVEAKQATQEIAIINNYENELTDVAIVGRIPNIGETQMNGKILQATFEMNLTQSIQADEKVQVYYSEKAEETPNGETWTTVPEDFTKVRAFKLELPHKTIQPQEIVKISYPLSIEEDLDENEQSYTNVNIEYNYLGNQVDANSTICLKTEEKVEEIVATQEIPEMKIQLLGRTGKKPLGEGQEVYEGQGIKYIAQITNTSGKEITNLKITASQENAIFYDEKIYQDGWDSLTGNEQVEYTRIEENAELLQKEITVGTLKVGETKEIAYQFSVKQVETKDAFTSGKIIITADEIEEKEIETLKNPIHTGKLKLQMRSKLEEEYDITTNREYPFLLDVINLTDETQENIVLSIPVQEGFDFQTNSLFEADNYEFIEYKNKEIILEIPRISAKETITIRLGFQIKSMDLGLEYKDYSFIYQGTLGDEIYQSNEMERRIYNAEIAIEAKQYGSIQDEWVKDGQHLTYTCEIKNKTEKAREIDMTDYLPMGVQIQSAKVQKYNISGDIENLVEEKPIDTQDTHIIYHTMLQGKEKVVITIDTIIDANQIFTREITNEIVIYGISQEIKCNAITYKVRGKEDIKEPETTFNIRGIAWLDENKNGLKETDEVRLPNIPVFLLDEKTGGIAKDENQNEMATKTDENGAYQFTNLKQGKYFVVFLYDTTKYRVTQYQKVGTGNENNSDVIHKNISLQEKEQSVAMTGVLELTQGDLEYIDAGFILGEKFNLKLDKYIHKIILQNKEGTKVQQYNQSQLAKVELDSKQVNQTFILIEYKIQVTNEGELPGYANEIVDDKPIDLSFNSEINKNWYQTTTGELCTQELSNQLIKPGESKTVTLTLTKQMNQNNTGTIINHAEIRKTSNDYAIQDGETKDDKSGAEVIISIRTGAIMGISFMITIIAILGIGVYAIKKKV